MKKLTSIQFLVLTLGLLLLLNFLTGCASTGADANGSTSTLPWSKPESWEGNGMLGGAMGH